MSRDIEHASDGGVLCWGGPEHGRVVSLPADAMRHDVRFPVERRLHVADTMPTVSLDLMLPTVAYRPQREAVWWDDGCHETWWVLIYRENELRLRENFQRHVNAIFWMAEPTRWTHRPPETD